MRKYWILTAIIICLLLPVAAGAEWLTAAENTRLTLYYDPEVSQIMLEDRKTGETWRSTPEDISQDKIASGLNKLNRQSDLIVMFHNPSYVTNQVNSFTGSIKNGDFTWELTGNGVEIHYYFPKQGFLIPVRYELEEDCLRASVVSAGIQENLWSLDGEDSVDAEKEEASARIKMTVVNVALLPYMGAAGAADKGYMIIPDGSGALIHFNNGRSSAAVYQQDIYGRDSALSLRKATTRTYQLNMPLFGMVRNGHAMLAVNEQGAFQTQLTALTAGQQTGYNNAYFTVNYLYMESNTLMADSAKAKDVTLTTNLFRDMGDFQVCYYPLEKENATYADVAAAYREMLGLKKTTETFAAVQIELIASIPSVKTVLGIPYNSITVLTDYRDAAGMLTTLGNNGVKNMTLRYTGWSEESTRGKVTTAFELDRRLGSKEDFENLLTVAHSAECPVLLTADLLNIYKSGNGYYSLFAATNNVNSTAKQMNEYLMSTGAKDSSGKTWYLMSPELVPEAAKKLADSMTGRDLGITLTALGNTIYSSFGKNGISRTRSGMYWGEALETLSQSVSRIAARAPMAYALPYIGQADQTPCYSSRFDVADEEIPFYQLVTHGSIALFSEPLNEAGNIRNTALHMIEYGVSPSWRMIARNPALLSGTDGADWYAMSFSDWKDEITELNEWMAPLAVYASMEMTGHEHISNLVSVTTYENGDSVIVNYGDYDVDVLGITVPAKDYAIKEAAR